MWLSKGFNVSTIVGVKASTFPDLSSYCSFFTFHHCCSIYRATPTPQEVVCSSGWGRISPSPSPLGDRRLRLLPNEVLHTASQRAAQRRLENPHQRYPVQRDHLDCGKVYIYCRSLYRCMDFKTREAQTKWGEQRHCHLNMDALTKSHGPS